MSGNWFFGSLLEVCFGGALVSSVSNSRGRIEGSSAEVSWVFGSGRVGSGRSCSGSSSCGSVCFGFVSLFLCLLFSFVLSFFFFVVCSLVCFFVVCFFLRLFLYFSFLRWFPRALNLIFFERSVFAVFGLKSGWEHRRGWPARGAGSSLGLSGVHVQVVVSACSFVVMSATLAKRKKPLASGKSKAKSKKKGFDSRYALPSQEEQQVLRQIGLDAATLSKNRAGAAGAMVGGGDADLKNSLMGGGDDGAAGTALAQSGLEVAHNSNLWGIQTKDLLKEQTFDYDHTAALTDALRTIKASVDSVPVPEEPVSRDSVDPRFMCTFLRRNDAADAADQPSVTLNFASPSAVDIVGSFLIRTQVRGPGANVDMALEMPDSCLDAKDYLNNRYFEKRALYLAVIAEHLEKEVGQQFDVRVSHFRDDERKSMLVLRAKDSAEGNEGENDTEDAKKSKKKKKKKKKKRSKAKSFPEIRILVTVSPTCQSLTIKRLRPGRTNVRVYGHTYGAPGTPEGALPTPHYSSAIVEDMCFKTHLQQLHVVAQKYPGFPGAVVLLKLWLSRRRYNCRSVGDGPDTARQNEEILITDTDCAGVTGFHLSMVLLHLVWQNKVQVHMQPLQMFRVALQFLGQRKGDSDVVASTGIVMCPRDKLGACFAWLRPAAAFLIHFTDLMRASLFRGAN